MMAAQVELQTGEVGRTVVGGRLHLNPLTDSSNKSLNDIPSINQSHIISAEPNKPAPGPKPRLSPKPFTVDKNPVIKPILAPKPHTKPRPESTRFTGYKPEPPCNSKPQQPPATLKPNSPSINPNRPSPTSFKTTNKANTGQTTKPVVQPFKPAPPFHPGDPTKPSPPVPVERRKPGASNLTYSKSLKKPPSAEWSGSTKTEDEDKSTFSQGGTSITRAKSMGFLAQVGQEEEEKEKAKPEEAVPLRPHPRGPRPRPVSAIFLDSPTKTDAPVPVPRWAGRRPLSADLTSKFESIGLSLHRKTPNADTKENTPEEMKPPQKKEQEKTQKMNTPESSDVVVKPSLSDQSTIKEEMTDRDTEENKRGSSIKSRISLLLDSSSTPGSGSTGQGSDLHSPMLLAPENEPPVGVRKLIKQLTEDTPPIPIPVTKPTLKPRPLPLDLTKRFSSERLPDLGGVPLSEAADHRDITRDPQMRNEESAPVTPITPITPITPMSSDHRTVYSNEQLQKVSTLEGPESGQMLIAATMEGTPGGELQTVRAALFENVVERHSVLMVDEAVPSNKPKGTLSSPSFKRGDGEEEGALVTATYREPASSSSPLRVRHAFDTVQAVEENRAVSENIPSAQREDKAMTLRSRRSEGSRPVAERTGTAQVESTPAMAPDHQPRILRVGALPKWNTSGHEQGAEVERGKLKESSREGELEVNRESRREAEQEEVAAAPKRLKILQAEEQQKPRATYFALTGQMQEPVSPVDAGANMADVVFNDFSVSSAIGGSQGKILPVRRNQSLEESFAKNQAEELDRSLMSQREVRPALDVKAADEMMEVGKNKETEKHKDKQKQLEREKQKQLEEEKQAHLEFARMRERERQREFERQRQKAYEKEIQEFEKKQRALEKQKQMELEKQRLQELERERQRELEKERQRQLEKEKRREMEREMELEREKLREQERERQRELERQRQREEERQRELDKERQLMEIQKEKQRMEELERRQLLELQKQKQKERERLHLIELEKQRLREKMEREEAEKIKQMAFEQEMLRLREIDKERERQRQLEKEHQKEMERERERQREQERQRQLDLERLELEKQRARQQELEKEKQRKEELERLMEMERRRLFEYEKQKQAERQQILELEKRRLRERMEKEEAEKMRLIAKQQEAERQRLKEKQRKEEQERLRMEAPPLRPQVLDLDSVLRIEPLSKPASQRSDLATRWKEPSPRMEEVYKPAILDIDAFSSQNQHSPSSRDLFAAAAAQGMDAGSRLMSQSTPDVSWKVPAQTPGGFSSSMWTASPQDPWELQQVEMSVDKPMAEPRKHSNVVSPEQLLLRQEERLLTPQRHWSTLADDPLRPGLVPGPAPAVDTRIGVARSSSVAPADQVWFLREPQPPDSRVEDRSQRRSQGSQELNRMRSRSVSRRSAPSTSTVEGSLSRMRSRSAHREQDRHNWVQQKQNVSGEEEENDQDTPVRDTDSQYGTWETGLRTDDSLTPATPSSESNLSPSPKKPTPLHTPGDRASHIESDTLTDGFLPKSSLSSSDNQPLAFPEAPTTLLNTSALRSKAQLGKRRGQRTRPTRAAHQSATPTESGAPEDWLFRDSTEAKVERKEDEEEEEQARGAEAQPAAASQPQRVALFPGMDPSALKAQLKKRGDSDNQSDAPAPSPSQLSRSPKSPFLPRAARVLPPPGGKENGEEDSPQWLKELKSKKRLSQYENES